MLHIRDVDILDGTPVFDIKPYVLGTVQEIRARAATHRTPGAPAWIFSADRQGWHYQNAQDTGWPVKDHLQVILEQDDSKECLLCTFEPLSLF